MSRTLSYFRPILTRYGTSCKLARAGAFTSVNDAYLHLTTNSLFLDTTESSYLTTNSEQRSLYVLGSNQILQRSFSYINDTDAIDDVNAVLLSRCRQQVVFAECYLKVNSYEIVFLYSGSMYLKNLDVNSASDRQAILDALTGDLNNEDNENYTLISTALIKENGVWKALSPLKLNEFLIANVGSMNFTKEANAIKVHVESSINASGIRTFVEN